MQLHPHSLLLLLRLEWREGGGGGGGGGGGRRAAAWLLLLQEWLNCKEEEWSKWMAIPWLCLDSTIYLL